MENTSMFASILSEFQGKQVVVEVSVPGRNERPTLYYGTLQKIGGDYLVLAEEPIERYIPLGAIVSFYEHKDMPVTEIGLMDY